MKLGLENDISSVVYDDLSSELPAVIVPVLWGWQPYAEGSRDELKRKGESPGKSLYCWIWLFLQLHLCPWSELCLR